MKTLLLDNNGRFLHWDALIAQALSAFKKEQSLIYESLRELSRNQRVVYARTAQATGQKNATDDGTYCDIIEPGEVKLYKTEAIDATGKTEMVDAIESHESFGLVLRVQTDETGETDPLEYGYVRFRLLADGETPPVSNLKPLQDDNTVPSYDKQVMLGLRDAMVGNDNLSFMYTPYVMMITRLQTVGLDNVHLIADEQEQTFSMQAMVGDYLVDTHFNLGVVRNYFNL